MNTRITRSFASAVTLAVTSVNLTACFDVGGFSLASASDMGDTSDSTGDGGQEGADEGGAPGQSPVGDAEGPVTRQLTRLNAEQIHASLQVATGQSWADYEVFAASLGRPDLIEVTQEKRDLSVSFDKFVHDAARDTCRAAIDADGSGGSSAVLLRYASLGERDESSYRENLRYLMLRFMGVDVAVDDGRLDPFLHLLNAAAPEGADSINDVLMADRWWAVCVAFATHSDFLSY